MVRGVAGYRRPKSLSVPTPSLAVARETVACLSDTGGEHRPEKTRWCDRFVDREFQLSSGVQRTPVVRQFWKEHRSFAEDGNRSPEVGLFVGCRLFLLRRGCVRKACGPRGFICPCSAVSRAATEGYEQDHEHNARSRRVFSQGNTRQGSPRCDRFACGSRWPAANHRIDVSWMQRSSD